MQLPCYAKLIDVFTLLTLQTSTISTGPVFGPQSKQSGSSKHAQSGTQDRPVSPKRQKREPELLKRQVL